MNFNAVSTSWTFLFDTSFKCSFSQDFSSTLCNLTRVAFAKARVFVIRIETRLLVGPAGYVLAPRHGYGTQLRQIACLCAGVHHVPCRSTVFIAAQLSVVFLCVSGAMRSACCKIDLLRLIQVVTPKSSTEDRPARAAIAQIAPFLCAIGC